MLQIWANLSIVVTNLSIVVIFELQKTSIFSEIMRFFVLPYIGYKGQAKFSNLSIVVTNLSIVVIFEFSQTIAAISKKGNRPFTLYLVSIPTMYKKKT